jgi:hypothetical protein
MTATLGRSFNKPSKLGLIAFQVAISMVLYPTLGHALGTESERAACAPDVFRLCSSEIPNIDRIIACMKAKRASLSTPCKLVFDKELPGDTAQNSHPVP